MNKYLCFFRRLVVLVLMMFFVSACGGSSSSQESTLTGTAAAGAAISGFVYAKGANGATASAEIFIDGSFNLDVNGLELPYILYAEGTVNWEYIKIYSVALTDGNINVTTITDLIVKASLEEDVDTAYANWSSSSIDPDVLIANEARIQEQLQPLLSAAGLPEDINLLTFSFLADHTGLDMVLDSITITYDPTGTVVTVTNNLTDYTYTDDLTTDADDADAGFPAEDEGTVIDIFADAQAINEVWQVLVGLYVTEKPTLEELNTTWAPHIAEDYLNRGSSRTEELEAWSKGKGDPCVGFKVTGTIKRELLPNELIGEITTYPRGYLVNMYYYDGCVNTHANIAMVYDGTEWLLFGDRVWLGDFGPKDRAVMYVNVLGEESFSSGLALNVRDSDSNYAYNNGVRSAIVVGTGLPEGGVILENSFPYNKFVIYQGQDSPCGYYSDEWCLTDEIIETIPVNAQYITYLFAEDAATVAADADPINNLDNIKYGSTLNNKPYLNSELNSSLFPVLVTPTPPAIENLNIPGVLEVTWLNPPDSYVTNVELEWNDGVSGISLYFITPDCTIADSTTFDSTGLNPPVEWANIHMTAVDDFGRNIGVNWQFE